MHVHLFSDDPVAAAAWCEKHLLLTPRSQLKTERACGRVIDHIAVSVDNLDETLAWLRGEGVTVLTPPRKANGLRSAFVQAPDNMELEILEGHAHR
jgi:catechol 2,3-dioxygenase-like lactoylglutathione lyase family enzyme